MQRNFSLALTSMLKVFTSQTYHYYHYHNNFEIPKNEGQILISKMQSNSDILNLVFKPVAKSEKFKSP